MPREMGADPVLLLRVLRRAPEDPTRTRIRDCLARTIRMGGVFRWHELSPSEAMLLWEDVVWLGHLFGSEERIAVRELQAHLERLMRRDTDPLTLSSDS
jgi:hypothetical protein